MKTHAALRKAAEKYRDTRATAQQTMWADIDFETGALWLKKRLKLIVASEYPARMGVRTMIDLALEEALNGKPARNGKKK